MSIKENYQRIREMIPPYAAIIVAAKTRTPDEVAAVIEAGATHIGANYVQEGMQMQTSLGPKARDITWHMIGHLQKNKISRALRTFDLIQSVDSVERATAIDARVEAAGKRLAPILLEINIGSEESKAGLSPAEHEPFEEYMQRCAERILRLEHVRLEGLMTMGRRVGNPQESRPYFRRVKNIFDRISALHLPNVDMRYLSMGMTNSYHIALEEGANMVRIGTAIFGERG